MKFSEVLGQDDIKQQLLLMTAENRLPHALLFSGPEGCGKLPMALAFASYLLCHHPSPDGECCGQCNSCMMLKKFAHPDLHFAYPVIKAKGKSGEPLSAYYLDEWRQQLEHNPYFDRTTWLKDMGVENQQAQIYAAQGQEILQSLSLKSSQGGYKIMIIWLPELMHPVAANKLLKIIEEPPAGTLFMLISENPDKILGTILSRTQRIDFKPLPEALISRRLQTVNGLQAADANDVAHFSQGNLIKAEQQLLVSRDTALFFDLFVLLMRLSYSRKVKDLLEWSEQVSSWGREKQKNFLAYCQRLVRENFIYNFHKPQMNHMEQKEAEFAVRFARFINERNVIGIMDELAMAQRDIEQNANARIVLFDFALHIIVLLIK